MRKKKKTTIKMNINQASNNFSPDFFPQKSPLCCPLLGSCPCLDLATIHGHANLLDTQAISELTAAHADQDHVGFLKGSVYQQSISSLSAVISHGRPSPSLFSYVFMPSSRSTAEMLQGSMVSASPPAAGSVVTSHVTCGDVLCSKIKTQL